MAKKFTELRASLTQAAGEKADGMARQMLAEMPLNELRQARGLSQKMLAEVLHVQQPSIAKLEKRTDMVLSTLRSHIVAINRASQPPAPVLLPPHRPALAQSGSIRVATGQSS